MNIRTGLQATAVGIALFCTAVKAEAAIYTFTANLSGAAEAPPNGSPGTGQATVEIDTVLATLHIDTSFSNLLGTTTIAHIHCCTLTPFTGTAPPATTVPSLPGFPTGVTFGSYSNTFSLLDPATYNPAFILANGGSVFSAALSLQAALFDGTSYFNIHTTAFPGGEIRGFLDRATPVPGPIAGAGIPALLALGGFVWARRRKAPTAA